MQNVGDFRSEIVVLKNVLKEQQKPPATITDIVELLKPKCGFPGLHKLFTLILTIPISNVAAERSFSVLRRLRNHLRTTMTEERISSLALLTMEKQMAQDIDLNRVVDRFASLCDRRRLTLI